MTEFVKVGRALVNLRKVAKVRAHAEAESKTAKRRATDRFGSRLGSKVAQLNACLSKKPKTMVTLVKEAGLEGT
jgi:hypothetical protein